MSSKVARKIFLALGFTTFFLSCASTNWQSLSQEELNDRLFEAVEYSDDPQKIAAILNAGAGLYSWRPRSTIRIPK